MNSLYSIIKIAYEISEMEMNGAFKITWIWDWNINAFENQSSSQKEELFNNFNKEIPSN